MHVSNSHLQLYDCYLTVEPLSAAFNTPYNLLFGL